MIFLILTEFVDRVFLKKFLTSHCNQCTEEEGTINMPLQERKK